MFLDDSPIQGKRDDLLNRGEFAKKIGQSILSMSAENGLCIGMFGPWGSGKTSILNMLLEEINQKVAQQGSKPIVFSFNPWNFTTAEQLFHQFFYLLASKFASSSEQKIKDIGDALKKYANVAAEISSVTQFSAIQLAISSIGAVDKFLSTNNILNDNDLIKQRNIIIKRLREQKQKIVIIIDDIDRLPNSEIRLIFQLVNSVAKFPNTVYLLSFDRKIVANALSGIQNCDGNDFLEKIIQVPIEIPEIREDRLNKILFAKLNEILKTYGLGLDQGHWQFVFKHCLEGNIKTIRDINRLINTLHTKCILIGNEVDFADLVAISFIENNYPDLYYWIKMNSTKLIGDDKFWKAYNQDRKKIIEQHKDEILKEFPDYGELYNDMLGAIFPFWSQFFSETEEQLWRKRRLGHSAFFDRYFCLGLDDGQIPRVVIEQALFAMNEQELLTFLNEVSEKYSIKYFLTELKAALGEIEDSRKLLVAKLLIKQSSSFKEEKRASWFELPIIDLVEFQIIELLKGIKDENLIYCLLKNEIENIDKSTIGIISKLLNMIELSYGRLAANGEKRNDCESLVSEKHLLEFERLYIDSVKMLATNVDLFELNNSNLILFLLERLDEKGFEQYVHNRINDNIGILKYLHTLAIKGTANDGSNIWEYPKELPNFLTESRIKTAYVQSLKNGDFWRLPNDMQLSIIAFELWLTDQKDWTGNIPLKLVLKRQNELKVTYQIQKD